MLRKSSATATTTGSAGSAAGEAKLELHGVVRLHGVLLKFTAEPATTDVTVTDLGNLSNSPLVQTNSNTSKMYYPVVAASKGADGTASTLTEVAPLVEGLKLVVAQADPAGTVEVTAYYETI